jgi:hypothetical protein
LAKNINHEVTRHAVFSNLPSPHPSSVQISSSAPCPQTPSVYAPPLMSVTSQVFRRVYNLLLTRFPNSCRTDRQE